MNNFSEKIIPVNIEEELKSSYMDYAMSVIVGRALPDVRDGLKPVHRRILYAMKILNNDWDKPHKKSARIVGDVIGKYHPHGDTAVYDTIVRMAQSFSLRYVLIDGQGNFGSVDGDSAAAMRYTEIRMSKIAHELLSDLDKNTVNYINNYDNTEKIPEIMPAKIPNLLINGSSGIAVGMATNIPPHNLSEVINGCLAYIENEDIDIKDLMKHIPGPDFPTSAIINGQNGIEDAYRTGKGKIYVRARTSIEKDINSNKETIIIHEIPYQVNKSKLIEKMVDLIKEKKIDGISSIRDESDKEGMRIAIEIKNDTNKEVILNNLYSLTKLQISFNINMVALQNGQPKILNLKDIISAFIQHRKDIILRKTNFELKKAKDRISILEALIIALSNIKTIIDIVQNTPTPEKAQEAIISRSWNIKNNVISLEEKTKKSFSGKNVLQSNFSKKNNCYFLTIDQAKEILNLSIQKLNILEYKKIVTEYKELKNKINQLKNILKDFSYLKKIIREELIYIKEKYNDPRKTEIILNNKNINLEDLIKKEDVVLTFSYYGYVKYQPLRDYEAQKRGGKGKLATAIKEKDFINILIIANTHDTILLFSNYGRMYLMKVHQLPEASRTAKGKPIINLIPLANKERITAILPLKSYKKEYHVFMATANGIVKKTPLVELLRSRNTGIIAINLNEGDELIGVDLTNGKDEVMLFSSFGKIVRFSENHVRSVSRTASGVRGINLKKNDKVVSLIIPYKNSLILTITKYGYGKLTKQIEYPTKSRATQGVISIKIGKRNGTVVGAIQVNNSDQAMIITNTGMLVRIRISEISIIGRNTKGVTLIKTKNEEHVVGIQRISEKSII